jgi:hypothetical protein
MTNSFPAADYDPQATVYDINGNAIGTIADIYFDDSSEPAFTAAQTRQAEVM